MLLASRVKLVANSTCLPARQLDQVQLAKIGRISRVSPVPAMTAAVASFRNSWKSDNWDAGIWLATNFRYTNSIELGSWTRQNSLVGLKRVRQLRLNQLAGNTSRSLYVSRLRIATNLFIFIFPITSPHRRTVLLKGFYRSEGAENRIDCEKENKLRVPIYRARSYESEI